MCKINQFFMLLVLFSLFSITMSAQELKITGIVKDNEGLTLPGVSVLVKGTSNGTITSIDGEYSISVAKGSVLVFSYVGYKTQEHAITNQQKINVTLETSSIGLDEVVVVGYGTQSRRTVTSAISKVGGEALDNVPVNNVAEGLKGKIAGARLYSNNNSPGADPIIRIRGGSSINKSNDPLVLVDGVERSFAGINPNDIESIDVLKDAASTAIYGSRASNGVVLVTTKQGTRNAAPRITFDANLAWQGPETLRNFMNAEDYINTVRPAYLDSPKPEAAYNSGFSASSGNTAESIYSSRWLKSGESVPAGYKSMVDPIDPTKTLIFQDNDFQSLMFRPTVWQNYYVGIDGGNDIATYSASLGYTNDGGVALATGYDRFNARLATTINISKKLRANVGFEYSKTNSEEFDNQNNVIVRGLSATPTQRIYFDDGTPVPGYNASALSPVWNEYITDRARVDKYLSVYGGLKWTIIDGLSADLTFSNYNQMRRKDASEIANKYNGLRPVSRSFYEWERNKLEAYLSYSKTFNNMHSLSAMAGYSYQNNDYNDVEAAVSGGSSDQVPTLSAGPTKTKADSKIEKEVLIGFFGRLNYDYMKKYMLSLTFREDASSRFAKGNQWGFFPGASVGWMMSEEPFFEKARKTISSFKWRVSYGQTGNNSIGLYDAYGTYKADNSTKYNGIAGIRPTILPNMDLTWEVSTQLDAGFDVSFFDNRLSIGADYFHKITDNLLFDKELPNTSGFDKVQTNIGKVRYSGFDLEISSHNIQTKDFSWDSKLTWSFVKNKVLKLPDNGRDRNRIGGVQLADGTAFGGIAEGESLYRYYGYVVEKIIETQQEADNARYDDLSQGWRPQDRLKVKGRKAIGDYEWKNREGSVTRDGKEMINSQDQFELGVTVPHSTGGLTNTFRYKNFNFGLTLDWALGHYINDNAMMRYFMNTFAGNYTIVDEVKQCWKQPGDNTKYAKFNSNDPDEGNYNFSRTSDVFNYKGDYLCIREVYVQYNLPKVWISKIGMQDLAVTLSGNNLYYFTAVKGVSPEVGASTTYANDYYAYPPVRKVSIGVKATF